MRFLTVSGNTFILLAISMTVNSSTSLVSDKKFVKKHPEVVRFILTLPIIDDILILKHTIIVCFNYTQRQSTRQAVENIARQPLPACFERRHGARVTEVRNQNRGDLS
jgi:hypothetical protein